MNISFSVASLTLVSPGAVNDGVTLYFFLKKSNDYFIMTFFHRPQRNCNNVLNYFGLGLIVRNVQVTDYVIYIFSS